MTSAVAETEGPSLEGGSGTEPAPPFGYYALPSWREAVRRWAVAMPAGGVGRRLRSLCRRAALIGWSGAVDLSPFPGQRVRLYPRGNLCEKRVFQASETWEAEERAALAEAMGQASQPFHFVDAGANVGLYTLAVRALGPIKALAIEADPVTATRLRTNLALSGTRPDEVSVAEVALGAQPGTLRLLRDPRNRGAQRVSDGGAGVEVPADTLLAAVRRASLARVDALKIDIEGHEAPVLEAFFGAAPRTLWPGLVIIEAPRDTETPALALLAASGYQMRHRTKMNAILAAPEGAGPNSAE
ncbi:MAG: FkbM family methyltransferase [Paracoccaceae bacterium]